jgi:hypothetical protein
LLDAFADELEKVGGLQKEAVLGKMLGRVGKGLKHSKGYFGKLGLGLSLLFLPGTMKRTSAAARGMAPKHLAMKQSIGRPKQIRGFY